MSSFISDIKSKKLNAPRYYDEHLKLYTRCPLRFLYNCYYGLIPPEVKDIDTLFYISIRQILVWSIMSFTDSSFNWDKLVKRWESAWANVCAANNFIDEFEETVKVGLAILNKFYYSFPYSFDIVAVEKRFEIGVGSEDPFVVMFEGTLIRTSDKDYELILFSTPHLFDNSNEVDRHFDPLLHYAVSRETPWLPKEINLKVRRFDVQSGTWKESKPSAVAPSTIVSSIRRGIKNNIFYPRASADCKTCPFASICNSSHSSEKMLRNRYKFSNILQKQLETGIIDNEAKSSDVRNKPVTAGNDLTRVGDLLPVISFDDGGCHFPKRRAGILELPTQV